MLIAGTGSRSLQTAPDEHKLAVYEETLEKIQELDGENEGMSGMSEGFDKCLAVCILKLEMPLHLAIPNRGYGDYYWGRNSLTGEDKSTEFQTFIDRATSTTYVMEDVHRAKGLYLNGVHSNFVRNQYMVDQADFFIVYNPTSPGTRDCVARIEAAGKPYVEVGA